MTLYTDQGTLQLLQHLEKSSAERLNWYIDQIEKMAPRQSTIYFKAHEFIGRDDIVEMKLEVDDRNNEKLISTVKLKNNALWRRGQLRIPDIVLPEIIKSSLKGRKIEEVVENPPFKGFTITGSVQDGRGSKTKLRLRCTAEEVGPIRIDPEKQPRRTV